MDRYIPCRVNKNLQSKFEAVSKQQEGAPDDIGMSTFANADSGLGDDDLMDDDSSRFPVTPTDQENRNRENYNNLLLSQIFIDKDEPDIFRTNLSDMTSMYNNEVPFSRFEGEISKSKDTVL